MVGSPFTNVVGTTITGGTYLLGGTFKFDSANIVNNGAVFELDGPASQVIDQSGNDGLRNLASVTPAGGITLRNGRNLGTPGAFQNAGEMVIGPNSAFTVGGNNNYMQTGGSTTLTDGTLQLNGTTDLIGGTYSQGGTDQYNLGLPSLIAGSGTPPAGDATLAGNLDVVLVGGHQPVGGNVYEVITFGSRTGNQFDALNLPDIGPDLQWQTDYNPSSLTLTVVAGNDPPVLAAVGDQAVDEGQVLNVPIAASDADGTNPVLSAANLPPFASFTDNGNSTGTLSLAGFHASWELSGCGDHGHGCGRPRIVGQRDDYDHGQ